MKGKYRSESPEDRIIQNQEESEEVKELLRRINKEPAKRVEILVEILRGIKSLPEPAHTDRLRSLKLAVGRGFLHAELEEAIVIYRTRQRGRKSETG